MRGFVARKRLQVIISDDLRARLDKARAGRKVGPIVRAALDEFLHDWSYVDAPPSDFDYLYEKEE